MWLLPTEHIRGPFLKALETQQIRSMPNSFLPPAPVPLPGMILLGDAMNMRHPLTGAGMSVALNDTLLWRELLRGVPDLRDTSAVLSCLRKFHWRRKMSHSFVVNVLAQALYALFSASDGKQEQWYQCVEVESGVNFLRVPSSAASSMLWLLSAGRNGCVWTCWSFISVSIAKTL